jgi:hypothetical protein
MLAKETIIDLVSSIDENNPTAESVAALKKMVLELLTPNTTSGLDVGRRQWKSGAESKNFRIYPEVLVALIEMKKKFPAYNMQMLVNNMLASVMEDNGIEVMGEVKK